MFLPYWHSGQAAASVSIYLSVAICQMFKSKQWKQQKYILFSIFKRFVWVLRIYNSMIDGYIRWMNDCIGNIANQKFISTIYARRINGMRVLKCVFILIQHKSYFVSSYFFFLFLIFLYFFFSVFISCVYYGYLLRSPPFFSVKFFFHIFIYCIIYLFHSFFTYSS